MNGAGAFEHAGADVERAIAEVIAAAGEGEARARRELKIDGDVGVGGVVVEAAGKVDEALLHVDDAACVMEGDVEGGGRGGGDGCDTAAAECASVDERVGA